MLTKKEQTLRSIIIAILKKAGYTPYNKKKGNPGYMVWCDRNTSKVFVTFAGNVEESTKVLSVTGMYNSLSLSAKGGSPFIVDRTKDIMILVLPYKKERANIKYLPKFI
jgi:hypothetical protein